MSEEKVIESVAYLPKASINDKIVEAKSNHTVEFAKLANQYTRMRDDYESQLISYHYLEKRAERELEQARKRINELTTNLNLIAKQIQDLTSK